MNFRDPAKTGEALDAEFFRRRPERNYRLRPALPLEAPAGAWIASRRSGTGCERLFFHPPGPMPPGEAPEHVAREVFEQLLATHPGLRLLVEASEARHLRRMPAAFAAAERRHGIGRA
jgi:hypothetical protein